MEAKSVGSHASVVEAGPWSDMAWHELRAPGSDQVRTGKCFLKAALGLTGMEVSLNRLPAGAQYPYVHRHQRNEELYLFVQGEGQMWIDGHVVDVGEGSALRLAPPALRTLRASADGPLDFVVVQATDGSLGQWTKTDGEIVPQAVEWRHET